MRPSKHNQSRSGIHLGLPFAVIGASAACLVLGGVAAVNSITALTRENASRAARDLVALRAQQIEAFFSDKGEIVSTLLADPGLLDWLADYDEFRRPLESDPGWARIHAYLRAVTANDPDVISAFVATASTGEYFRPEGRVEREGYDARQRWWWSEALGEDRLYVSPPGIDAGTGEVAVTVQTTLYDADGQLLGVGGIDVLLGTLGGLVGTIRYRGSGEAFLVDADGHVIYFPGLDLESGTLGDRVGPALGTVDEAFPDTDGFAGLAAAFPDSLSGLERARFNGEEALVVHAPVRTSRPELSWTLGLVVPERIITEVVRRTRAITALAIVLGVLFIAGVVLFVTRRVDERLREGDRQRAQVLAEANARLVEADRMKSQFLANMSHELRTPLNSIIGFSQILRERVADRLEDRFARFLDNIHASGQHLLGLISDILDLSKIEAGRLELNPEEVELRDLVEGVCAVVRGSARERGITILTETAGAPSAIEADPVRLKQILYNLLSNAVKFSDDGGEVRIVARQPGALESRLGVPSLELAVIDHGIGIPAAEQERIFDQFHQADGSQARRYEGTGLGLSLVRQLVGLHRGTIDLESEPGRGSTFTVTLPLRFHGSGPVAALDMAAMPPSSSRDVVLVVEDDTSAYERMRRDLTSAGFRPVRSIDGSDAVELATRLMPAAVVLDIILPGTDGWEILRELKARSDTRELPVIIVSVLDNHELGLALGADAYFTKPVERRSLVDLLARLAPPAGRRAASILVIDDEPSLHDYLDEVFGPLGYSLIHALSGADGLRAAREERPALVILDLTMDEISGFEVAERLRRDPATRDTPILVLTARELSVAEGRRLSGRVQALVPKGGGEPGDLVALVRRLLAERRATSRA